MSKAINWRYTAAGKAWRKEYNRIYRLNHPSKRTKADNARRKARADRLRALFKSNGCSICGEVHPACLDFHHRDPSQKKFTIGDHIFNVSLRRIHEEIQKCDIICANCHRKKHWQEGTFGKNSSSNNHAEVTSSNEQLDLLHS